MRPRPMKHISGACVTLTSAVLLGLAPLAVAHGNDGDMKMEIGGQPTISRPTIAVVSATAEPVSYFQYGEHSGMMFAHILIMTIAWVFVLPVGVMLSIGKTRSALPVQFAFLCLNATGVLLATIYNASTPDLYPNNAHHRLGWVLTWMMCTQVVVGVIKAYIGRQTSRRRTEQNEYLPVSTEAMEEHQRMENLRQAEAYRFSNDSGQGTERRTESLRSQSLSSASGDHELPDPERDEAEEPEEKHGLLHGSRVDRFLKSKIPGVLSLRVLRTFQLVYNLIDRTIMLIGFAGIQTGIATYGALFMGDRVFSGLAHFSKGGVFFWFGILSLGRWAGCFSEMGWAWNIKPTKSKRPSAEFVESFLIFFYGATNVFLEHLTAWGHAWSAQDLEHISITVMFIGGGLCGMLIESSRVRELLTQPSGKPEQETVEPKSYRFSMNPIPALVVLLVGMMMSSHHQESMFSTMLHQQWGTLLVGASFARAATYLIFYLSPPTSTLPGRPPTELIASFCLMAGGLIFMTSARDTVMAMESYDLEAMFVFTVSMGLIMTLVAWVIAVIAIKGWVMRREGRSRSSFRGTGMA